MTTLLASRVVVAVSPEVQPRIRAALPDSELRFVKNGPDLLRALDGERCDMLIVGTHFDESSAVAALERILSRPETFPVVCVRGRRGSRLGPRTLHALRTALDELGAQEFIDLLQYPDDALGNSRLQAMLERLISRECR